MTYDGTTAILYINGASVATLATSFVQNTSQPLTIGSTPSAFYFNGSIPITRIYNRALSASEVLKNFNAQKARFLGTETFQINGLVLNYDAAKAKNGYLPQPNGCTDTS